MQETIATIGMLVIKGVVIPVIGLFLAWASAHLPAWLKSKTTNTRAAGILERLGQLAMAVVQETEQTIVAGLGSQATPDELRKARDAALASLKSHLGDKGLKELEVVFGLQDQDAVIKMLITFIEQAVHTLGIQQTAMANEAAKTPVSTASTTVVVPPPAA